MTVASLLKTVQAVNARPPSSTWGPGPGVLLPCGHAWALAAEPGFILVISGHTPPTHLHCALTLSLTQAATHAATLWAALWWQQATVCVQLLPLPCPSYPREQACILHPKMGSWSWAPVVFLWPEASRVGIWACPADGGSRLALGSPTGSTGSFRFQSGHAPTAPAPPGRGR